MPRRSRTERRRPWAHALLLLIIVGAVAWWGWTAWYTVETNVLYAKEMQSAARRFLRNNPTCQSRALEAEYKQYGWINCDAPRAALRRSVAYIAADRTLRGWSSWFNVGQNWSWSERIAYSALFALGICVALLAVILWIVCGCKRDIAIDRRGVKWRRRRKGMWGKGAYN